MFEYSVFNLEIPSCNKCKTRTSVLLLAPPINSSDELCFNPCSNESAKAPCKSEDTVKVPPTNSNCSFESFTLTDDSGFGTSFIPVKPLLFKYCSTLASVSVILAEDCSTLEFGESSLTLIELCCAPIL